MLIVKENSIKSGGLIVGEPIIIKTRAFDLEMNEKSLMIDIWAVPQKIYEQKNMENFKSIVIDGIYPFTIAYNSDVLASWEEQNKLIEQKLKDLGVPADSITIVKDA